MSSSPFFGIEVGLRGLRAQQAGLDVTGHNVANANTPGFSRQRVELTTTVPLAIPGANGSAGRGQLGTGVDLVGIQRARDAYLDLRYRTEFSTGQQAEITSEALSEVEAIFNEPSTTGLASKLNAFFNAWQDLTSNPTDLSVRAVLTQQATSLADALNHTANQLLTSQQNLDRQVQLRVDAVNSLASRIADLNRTIVQAELGGRQANDLRDQRDLLVDQLAGLIQITTVDHPDGSQDILVGSRALVQGSTFDALVTTPTGTNGLLEVRFSSDNTLVTINSGTLRGLLDARDSRLPAYLAQLNTLASDLISDVNALHTTGYGLDNGTGRVFFVGTDATNIAVAPVVLADPRVIAAASGPNQPGGSDIALAIAQLRQNGSPPAPSALQSLIAGLGIDAQRSRDQAENQRVLVQVLDRRREEVAGVSLDEEAAMMLRYQRAYEAAARLITANDQLLDKLINETGLVGR